jgi:hypothetical protein
VPRTAITPQAASAAGVAVAYEAANVDGNSYGISSRRAIHAKNASAGALTVRVITPGTIQGLAIADRDVSVPAGSDRLIGIGDSAIYRQSDGTVHVDYPGGVTSLTVAVIEI